MKKLLLTIAAVSTQLVAMAQWTLFPGSATHIHCGSATKFATISGSTVYYYNFTTNAYVQLTGAAQFNDVGYAADGTLIARNGANWNATSNLIRFNNPPVYNAYTVITGIVDNNIDVRGYGFSIASVGTGTNAGTNNNIYKYNGFSWSTLAGSTNVSAKKAVGGGGFNDIYAMNWSTTGNNVMAYTSTGPNQGFWTLIPNSTLNVSDLSVGDASKVLAIAGGQLYYKWNDAWVLDATAPANLTKVSAAADGTIMLLTSANTIYRNTWANVNCGLNVATPINTTPTQNLTVCAGQSTTLTATGTGTLTWNGGGLTGTGSTFITPTVTSTTTFSVTNTDVAGCASAFSLITVSVSVSAPQFSSPTTSVCVGNSATLTATGTQTISWYDSPTSTTALATGTVFTTPTLTNNTSYYIATVTGSCETSRTIKTISVPPLPAQPVNITTNIGIPQTVCQGASTTLVLNTTAGSNWYTTATGGTSFLFSTQYTTPTTLTANATYYVDQTVNGCTSAPRVAIELTVTPIPSILSQTVQNLTCNGSGNGSISLTLNNPSSFTYNWTPNVSTTYSVTSLAAGIYTLNILSSTNGLCNSTQTFSVTQPAANNVPVNIIGGNTLNFNSPYTGGTTFQWLDCNNGNVPISGAINAQFTPTVSGSYALVVINGCPSTSTCTSILITGINENALLNNITLQPNPASIFFTLSNLAEGTSVNVMDVTGKVVVSSSVINEDKTMTVETNNLSNGIYMIQLKNNNAVAYKKLVINK